MFTLFSILRALHVLCAALWLGAGAMLTLFILPSVRDAGPAGGSVMGAAVRRGVPAFMASVGGLTILSGLWLYWLWARSVGSAGMHSTGGIMLGIGAACGIGAVILGGAVLSPTSKKIAALAAEGPPDEARKAQIGALQNRMASAGKLALTLMVLALLLMTLSRFA